MGLLLLRTSTTQAAEGSTADGERFEGTLVDLTSSWVASYDGRDALTANDLVYWGLFIENEQDPVVLLENGSTLVASVLEFTPESVVIGADPQTFGRSLWHGTTLPRTLVSGAVLRSLPDASARDRLTDAVRQHRGNTDVLWLSNGDRLEGLLTASQLTGRDPTWRIRTDGGDVEVTSESLHAVAFRKMSDDAPSTERGAGVLGFHDGSRVYVEQLDNSEQQCALVLGAGARVVLERRTFINELCYVRPPNPRVTYLSDQKVASYRHIPYLTRDWPYHIDRSVLDTRLRWRKAEFERGLGVHSTSRLAYDIPEGTERFQAELALDQSAGEQGSVVFRVYLQSDGGDFEKAFESTIVRGGDELIPVNLPTGNARRIALIVDFADHGDEMDRANWLMARFIRNP